MKKTLLFTTCLCLCTAACQKNNGTLPEVSANAPKTEITFSLCGDGLSSPEKTKATATASEEEAVSLVNLFVFNSDGSLDQAVSSNSKTIKANVTTGKGKKAYAIVNPESDLISTVLTEEDLLTAKNTALANAGTGITFGMSGLTDPTDIETTTKDITINVSRVLSKIGISKITNNLSSSIGALKIKRIYLSNVLTDAYYFKEENGSGWMHLKGILPSSPLKWLYDNGQDKVINNGKSLEEKHSFYCCPNYTVQESATDKFTKLVVEAEINGKQSFYPISLNSIIDGGKIQKNHFYDITELIIKHYGSPDPDTPLSNMDIEFTVNVTPWIEKSLSPVLL